MYVYKDEFTNQREGYVTLDISVVFHPNIFSHDEGKLQQGKNGIFCMM